MSKVKLGISAINTLQLLEKAQNMTGNPSYMTPVPSLASITNGIDDLTAANDASLSGSHQAVSLRNQKFEILVNLVRSLGGYVQAASGGDATVITSSGFEVAQSKTPVGLPPAVENMSAETSDYPGCADLKWKSLKQKAETYAIYCTQVDPASQNPNWELLGYSSKASYKAENLPNHNQYYWFSVVAINSAGLSVMSEPALARVL